MKVIFEFDGDADTFEGSNIRAIEDRVDEFCSELGLSDGSGRVFASSTDIVTAAGEDQVDMYYIDRDGHIIAEGYIVKE